MRIVLYVLPLVVVFVFLAVLLWFVSPWAPVLLLASLLLQAPIVFLIAKYTYNSAYEERLHTRKLAFEKEQEVDTFLQKEEQEAASFGYRLLTKKNKTQNILTRAEFLIVLEEFAKAEELFCELDPSSLNKVENERYLLCKNQLAHTQKAPQ